MADIIEQKRYFRKLLGLRIVLYAYVKHNHMPLYIKDHHTEVVSTTFFKIAGLPEIWKNSTSTPEMFKEIDVYLQSIGVDRFWLSNDDIQINFEHGKRDTTAEEILAKVSEIVGKYHQEAAA